uniref:Nicotinic acid mononucleotide adenylyltransferase n=1 Tax=Clandestinovirus TaxID=2831644 RepID=A0A8F8KLV6_9VIRU|nr:nicotinic acid mononucleotide adenylyltransferase [Clandestinovirus]
MIKNDETLTPLTKIRQQLQQYEQTGSKKRLTILIATGSYNPVHPGHFTMFNVAKEHLEKNHDVHVIGGFISPSHQEHVSKKLGSLAMKSDERIHLLNLATEDSDWIQVSSWECTQPSFVHLGIVTESIEQFVRQSLNIDVDAFYLCGSDLALKAEFHVGSRNMKFVCVQRPGSDHQLVQERAEYLEIVEQTSKRIVDALQKIQDANGHFEDMDEELLTDLKTPTVANRVLQTLGLNDEPMEFVKLTQRTLIRKMENEAREKNTLVFMPASIAMPLEAKYKYEFVLVEDWSSDLSSTKVREHMTAKKDLSVLVLYSDMCRVSKGWIKVYHHIRDKYLWSDIAYE